MDFIAEGLFWGALGVAPRGPLPTYGSAAFKYSIEGPSGELLSFRLKKFWFLRLWAGLRLLALFFTRLQGAPGIFFGSNPPQNYFLGHWAATYAVSD